MGDTLRDSKAAPFSEWSRRFLDEAEEDGFALEALDQLIGPEHRVSRGSIGINFDVMVPRIKGGRLPQETPAIAVGYGANSDITISDVVAGSPADQAGLKVSDTIISVDGKPIKNGDDLVSDIASRKPGAKVTLAFSRNGKKQETTVTVADRAKLFARPEVERKIVLELLFHHVNGNYGLGASPKEWKAFRSEINGLRRRALALASELERFSHLKIFCVPSFPSPGPAAFLARESGAFAWRQTLEPPWEDVHLSSAARELSDLAAYIKVFITAGDKIWSSRDFGNLNLILLSIFWKRVTGEWQDKRVAMLTV